MIVSNLSPIPVNRVLLVTPAVPYPVNSGQVTRTRNIMDTLRRLGCEVDLLLIVSTPPTPVQLEALRQDGFRTVTHVLRPFLKALAGYYSPLPEVAKTMLFRGLAEKVQELGPHTLVWCDGLVVASVLPVLGRPSRAIVDFRDTLSRLYDQFARNCSGPVERMKMKLIRRWRLAGELRALKHFPDGIIISEADKQWLRNLLPIAGNLTVLPVVIDVVDRELPLPVFPIREWLFAGDLRYPPNMESVVFLVRLMERVASKYPDWRLTVVGKGPPGWIPPSAPNVVFTGYVESMDPYLERSGAMLCPIFSGTGIKNKVLMAMAAKRPLIANAIALEGIPAIDGMHVLVAANFDEFEQAMARLANDAVLAESLRVESFRLVCDRFSLQALADGMQRYLERLGLA